MSFCAAQRSVVACTGANTRLASRAAPVKASFRFMGIPVDEKTEILDASRLPVPPDDPAASGRVVQAVSVTALTSRWLSQPAPAAIPRWASRLNGPRKAAGSAGQATSGASTMLQR